MGEQTVGLLGAWNSGWRPLVEFTIMIHHDLRITSYVLNQNELISSTNLFMLENRIGNTLFQADQRAVPAANDASHRVEWRPWQADQLQSDLQWQEADLQLAQMAGIQNTGQGLALCTWQFPATVQSPNLPDAVQFRVRKIDLDSPVKGGASSRTWLSQISGLYATAFAAPEKPRASLLADQDLKVVLAFALSFDSPSDERPTNSLKSGHGHGLVTRIQVSYRQAGDSHIDEVRELKPQDLTAVSMNDGLGTLKISVSQPQFLDGQRILFAVRVGDDWRWSHWSSFSKPVHVEYSDLFKMPLEKNRSFFF